MNFSSKDNANPLVHESQTPRYREENQDDDIHDEIDVREIFDLIRDINDPEHPLTLEDLRVVNEKDIFVDDKASSVIVSFTPTIPHCSMATLIGLAIRVQLLRALPSRFKVEIKIAKGTHQSETAVNKQLADKERVAAALENNHLLGVVNQCLTMKN
uniref:cytosolic iron-sulfur assembly component 2B-like n=1 Tax=Styela clava TaxID=7725 RepID=UPI00193A5D58|nr:cytosolic iron-sulfur assembly component 2B-like [Styela clava]